MANRKFHYGGKKKTSVSDGAPAERNAAQDNSRGRNDRQRRHTGSAQAVSRYPAEKTAVSVKELGAAENTVALLSKYRIGTVADLVSRTEKDMFKVQGFNKKMLLELKGLLAGKGMEFLPDSASVAAKGNVAADDKRDKQLTRDKASARDDRNARRGNAQGAKPTPKKEERPAKVTEPLPVEEWRKVQKGGKWGFYDGMKTVIPPMYDEVFCFKDGLASVELEEKCGYINPANEIVIPFVYETAMSFSEGLASVVKNGKCGYIDKQNEEVIPFIYDAATAFEEGEAKVKKDGRWGTIFPDGSVKWI